jgi:hypothetical protein
MFIVDKKSPAKNLFDMVVFLSPHTKLGYPTTILAVLEKFRYDINSFNGAKVHSLLQWRKICMKRLIVCCYILKQRCVWRFYSLHNETY